LSTTFNVPGPYRVRDHLSPFVSVPETVAEGTVESTESNWRVSRLSVAGRSDRLEGVGFRVDMGHYPLSHEARPTVGPGAHLERRSALELNSDVDHPCRGKSGGKDLHAALVV
jgi:hypothetical protein